MTVDNQLVSSIGRGLLVLAGVGKGDDEKEADSLISRIMRCRLWPDDNGKQVGDARPYYSRTRTIGTDVLDSGRRMSRILKARYSAVWPVTNVSWMRSDESVSQFTLYAQLNKGKQLDFHEAADVETARRLYDYFYQRLREAYKPERVKNGVFQAMMDVELKNDGPVGLDYRSDEEAV